MHITFSFVIIHINNEVCEKYAHIFASIKSKNNEH